MEEETLSLGNEDSAQEPSAEYIASSNPQNNYLDEILDSVSPEHPLYAVILFQWSTFMCERYIKARNPRDLEEALSKAEQAITALEWIDSSHPSLPGWLDNHAHILELKYDRDKDLGILGRAISQTRRAVDMASSSPSDLIIYLNNLGNLYEKRFIETNNKEDLTEAIDAAQKCEMVTPLESPFLSVVLLNLGGKLKKMFQAAGDVGDLNNAIECQRRALEAADPSDTRFWMHQQNMGNLLQIKYDRMGIRADLDEAVQHAETLVQETSVDKSMLPSFLSGLSDKLWRRYQLDGSIQVLDDAIMRIEEAIALVQVQGQSEPEYLIDLGNLLEMKYDASGDRTFLDRAIAETQRSQSATASFGSNSARYLNCLGNKKAKQFEISGRMEDLEEAIRHARQAVNLTAEVPPDAAAWRSVALADKLEKKFERIGAMGDLEEAIFYGEQAIRLLPADHPTQIQNFNMLGNFFERKFDRCGEMIYLEKACDLVGKALQMLQSTQPRHPEVPTYLNNLGNKLAKFYRQTKEIDKLYEAVSKTEQAVEKTPADHKVRPLYLNGLAVSLHMLYESVGGLDIIEKAIQSAEEAVKLAPAEDPRQAIYLYTLAQTYSASLDDVRKDLELKSLLRAWNCQNGAPFYRILSARAALRLFIEQESWSQAQKIAREAVSLLHVVNTRFLSLDDQQHAVSYFSGLAADACSLTLQIGMGAFQALAILEEGRGSILSILMDFRSDISQLMSDHPNLCRRYELLRAELSAPTPETQDTASRRALALRRQEALKDLDAVVEEIESLPQSKGFSRHLTEDQMLQSASTGYIVVVNITEVRADAFIVSQSCGLKVILLPNFKAESVKKWLEKDLTNFKRAEYGEKNKLYRKFLGWLWSSCVKTVIGEIERHKNSKEKKYKIWWIGTGLASSLPFHAAGNHSIESSNNTFSHAISSYTPTIKALRYAHENISKPVSDPPKLLLVAMRTTPGEESLPGVDKEIEALGDVLAHGWSVRLEKEPSSATVLQGLEDCDIAHFACHGVSNFLDPAKSHLILQKLQGSGPTLVQDLLTVRQISETGLKNARIAYLSACSTAENKAQRLADEVLHLASGFQVAGFGHVVASMWPAGDDVCVRVARCFYEKIAETWNASSSSEFVASALQTSVERVRDIYRKQPLAWAQFIHIGV